MRRRFVSRPAARPESPETILAERYGLREGTLSCASIGSGRAVDLEVGHHGMRDADYNCTARTEKGEWVGWTLVVRSPKAGFFDAKAGSSGWWRPDEAPRLSGERRPIRPRVVP